MAWRLTELRASTLPVPFLRVSALSAKVTQQATVTRLRISGISANATQQVVAPKLRVSGVSVSVVAARITVVLPEMVVEPGSVVTSTFPEYEGAVYSAGASAVLELRGSNRVRQFIAPASIREVKYVVEWRAVAANGFTAQGTQVVTVLPCTVRVVSGGVEAPSYFSDGQNPWAGS